MLSKEEANKLSKASEEKEISDLIEAHALSKEYSVEILNLTDYQQQLLKDAGYTPIYTANRLGYLWRITWE